MRALVEKTPARRHRERVMSDQRKPRGLARFREREVTRITKAVRVAGGGKVTLDPGPAATPSQ